MRVGKLALSVALATALVLGSVPAALAGGSSSSHSKHSSHSVPAIHYRITKPKVAAPKVTVGVSFDATGVVLPTIAADDTSTTVSVAVYRLQGYHRSAPVLTMPATLSSAVGTGTAYAATLSVADAGSYALVAIVTRDGRVVAKSEARPIAAVLPYRVTAPHAAARPVAGVAFEASGSVCPTIAADDTSTTVSLLAYQRGRHGKLTQVGSFDTTLAVATRGTAYVASVTLAKAGSYTLVAVVQRDGQVLGRSGAREVRVKSAPVAVNSRHRG